MLWARKSPFFSQSLKKQADGKRLGADHFYATSDPATFENLKKYFDLIICTVPTGIDWNPYLELLNVDGSFVIVGVPDKPVPLEAFPLIMGRRSLAGSVIGGIRETQEMLDFCGKHDIACDIEIIPIQKVNEAYERVLKSDVRYRFVIDMASLKAELTNGHTALNGWADLCSGMENFLPGEDGLASHGLLYEIWLARTHVRDVHLRRGASH